MLADIIRYVVWAARRTIRAARPSTTPARCPRACGVAGGLFALVVFARLIGKGWQP